MECLLESVNLNAAAVGIPIIAKKTKLISALIHGEQRQAVLLEGKALQDVNKFKYLGLMIVPNCQGTEEIRSRISFARSAFFRLHSCLWSQREICLRT